MSLEITIEPVLCHRMVYSDPLHGTSWYFRMMRKEKIYWYIHFNEELCEMDEDESKKLEAIFQENI